MALSAEKDSFAFSDFLTWETDERMEIIHGEVFMMAAPGTSHQLISGEIFRQLANFLDGRNCRAIAAPFAVRLFEKDGDAPKDVDTVVEPDISVICDRNKLDKHGCKGAPDLIVEVLSPSTQRHDQLVKLNLYQRAGVKEYWIADPENKTVRVMLLTSDGIFQIHEVYQREDVAKVNVLNGCFLELGRVFSE